jgi:hypothetical protein
MSLQHLAVIHLGNIVSGTVAARFASPPSSRMTPPYAGRIYSLYRKL